MITSDDWDKVLAQPTPQPLTWSQIEHEVYDTPDYYRDPAAYEAAVLAERSASQPLGRGLEALQNLAPGMTPDVSLATLTNGLAGNADAVKQLRNVDTALQQQTQMQQAQQQAQAQQQQESSATDDWGDWPVIAQLKGALRTGMITLEAPYDIAMNAYRAYGGTVTGQDNKDLSVGDKIANVFGGTELAQMVQTALAGQPIDTGDGWFYANPESKVSKDAQLAQGQLWTLPDGQIATFGRSAAELAGLDKDSDAYKAISGLLDAATRLVDPSMYVGAGDVATTAKVGAGLLKGGAAGGRAARDAANPIAALAKGASVARDAGAAQKLLPDVSRVATQVAEANKAVDAAAVALNVQRDTYRQSYKSLYEHAQADRLEIEAQRREAALAASGFTGEAVNADTRAQQVMQQWGEEHLRQIEAGKTYVEATNRGERLAVEHSDEAKRLREEAFFRIGELSKAHDDALAARQSANHAADFALSQVDPTLLKGVDDATDVAKVRAALEAHAGLVNIGDQGTVLVNKALNAVLGTKLDPIFRVLAEVKDPAVLYRMMGRDVPAPLLRAVARADDPEKVRAVFAGAVGRGEMNAYRSQLRYMRTMSRFVDDGTPYATEAERWAKVFDRKLPKAIVWSHDAASRRVPWSYRVHVDDADGMTNMTSDMIHYVTGKWGKADSEAFHDKWVRQMLDATTGEQRKALGMDMLNDLSVQALKRSGAGLDDDAYKAFREAFLRHKASAIGRKQYNANERELAGEGFKLLGHEYNHGNMGMLDSMTNEYFSMPDPKLLKRLTSNAAAITKNAGQPGLAGRVLDKVFDQYWRSMVLVRPSYVIRNIGEMGIRQYLMRHPSAFTNPVGVAAMVMNRHMGDGWARKVAAAFDPAKVDVYGRQWARHVEADESLGTALQGYSRWADRDTSMIDVGAPHATGTRLLGYETVSPGHPEYWTGVAHDAVLLNSSPLARDVLSTVTGRYSPELAAWMKRYKMDAEDALVDMAVNGPYREAMSKIGALNRDKATRDDLLAALRTPEGAREMLFSRDNEYSFLSRWANFTGNFDGKVVEALSDPASQGIRIDRVVREGHAAYETQIKDVRRVMRSQLAPMLERGAYNVKRAAVPNFTPKEGKNWFESVTNGFFHVSGKLEKDLAYLPEYKFAYWDSVADLIHGASPAVAERLKANAEKALGGPGVSLWQRRTLEKVRKARPIAEGQLTLDDIALMSDRSASSHVESAFYDAMKRNQLAHSVRLVFPFAQAWANSMHKWTELGAKQSQQVYKAAMLAQGLTGKDSNVMYSMLPDWAESGFDPNQGVLFRDPKSGQISVSLPFNGTAIGALAGLASGALGGPVSPVAMNANTPVNTMNLLFQNGIGPGFGPVPQMAAGLAAGQGWFENLPDFLGLKTQLTGFVDPNVPDAGPVNNALQGAMPAWAKGIMSYMGWGFAPVAQKYQTAAAAQLFAADPTRYIDPATGAFTADGARMLQDESAKLARGLALGQAMVKAVNPGSTIPQIYAKSKNGENVAQFIIAKEFRDLTAKYNGDRGLALNDIIDKYGINAVMTLVPSRKESVYPTDLGWKFLAAHGDQIKGNEDLLPLFVQGGQYSSSFDRWLRAHGHGTPATIEEQTAAADDMLFTAQESQLDKKLADNKITQDQHREALQLLRANFAEVPSAKVDWGKRTGDIERLRRIVGDSGNILAQTPAAEAIRQYLNARDQAFKQLHDMGLTAGPGSTNPFGAKKAQAVRAQLRAVGEDIASRSTEFKAGAWARVFRGEVK